MALAQLQAQARFVGVAATNAGVEIDTDQSRWVSRPGAAADGGGRRGAGRRGQGLRRAAGAPGDTARGLRAAALRHRAVPLPEARAQGHGALQARRRQAAEKLFAGDNKFDDLVSKIVGMHDMIRAPYHRFLELNEQTLAWMMAIDTCFLLDFLESYHVDSATDMVSSATSWINAVVRDAMMLENQIPLFLFTGALQLRDQAASPDAMHVVFDRFIKEVCPIKTAALAIASDVSKHAHLLELL